MSKTLALLEDLIRRPSVTPEDAGCCDVIAERLQALGSEIEWLPKNGVTNLWATWGSGGPLLVLAGHTDVCLLYTSPSPRDRQKSRMPSSA